MASNNQINNSNSIVFTDTFSLDNDIEKVGVIHTFLCYEEPMMVQMYINVKRQILLRFFNNNRQFRVIPPAPRFTFTLRGSQDPKGISVSSDSSSLGLFGFKADSTSQNYPFEALGVRLKEPPFFKKKSTTAELPDNTTSQNYSSVTSGVRPKDRPRFKKTSTNAKLSDSNTRRCSESDQSWLSSFPSEQDSAKVEFSRSTSPNCFSVAPGSFWSVSIGLEKDWSSSATTTIQSCSSVVSGSDTRKQTVESSDCAKGLYTTSVEPGSSFLGSPSLEIESTNVEGLAAMSGSHPKTLSSFEKDATRKHSSSSTHAQKDQSSATFESSSNDFLCFNHCTSNNKLSSRSSPGKGYAPDSKVKSSSPDKTRNSLFSPLTESETSPPQITKVDDDDDDDVFVTPDTQPNFDLHNFELAMSVPMCIRSFEFLFNSEFVFGGNRFLPFIELEKLPLGPLLNRSKLLRVELRIDYPHLSERAYSYNGILHWNIVHCHRRKTAEATGLSKCQHSPYFYFEGYMLKAELSLERGIFRLRILSGSCDSYLAPNPVFLVKLLVLDSLERSLYFKTELMNAYVCNFVVDFITLVRNDTLKLIVRVEKYNVHPDYRRRLVSAI